MSTTKIHSDNLIRLVNLEGSVNCRDLGGYKTIDNKQVKWEKVYRAADISRLTDSDLDEFRKRNIHTVVDFRDTQEVQRAPDKLLPDTDYLLCPTGIGNNNDFAAFANGHTTGRSIMEAFYSNVDILTEKYKPFFDKLLELPDPSALLFHCTAGKDRTGIAAALFLSALDIPRETIIEDYVATNVYRQKANEPLILMMIEHYRIKEEIAVDIMSTYPEYLESTFNAIDKKYDSLEKFLTTQMGLNTGNKEKLMKKFLE